MTLLNITNLFTTTGYNGLLTGLDSVVMSYKRRTAASMVLEYSGPKNLRNVC